MDTTIRNLDEGAYRSLRAQAVLEGRNVGEMISEAIVLYLGKGKMQAGKKLSLRELEPEAYPQGNENLSSEVDLIVYGDRR